MALEQLVSSFLDFSPVYLLPGSMSVEVLTPKIPVLAHFHFQSYFPELLLTRNWLSGRKQCVVLNGKKSTWREVLSRVPQGSVLGPILFLFFINDSDDEARNIDLLLKFADDTKLAHRIHSKTNGDELQASLSQLSIWAERWGMAFNVNKCKVMHVGRGNPGYQYMMDGQVLQETECERDIGVNIHHIKKPSAHCTKAA
jgi:ribonuclease P/MRP protein subunit RPP40